MRAGGKPGVYFFSLDAANPVAVLVARTLQRAEAEITVNTMAEASGLTVPPVAPLLHFAKRQDMVGWPLMAVE